MSLDKLAAYTQAAAADLRDFARARGVTVPVERLIKVGAPKVGDEVKAPGILRTSASSAWKVGENPPKPKTIGPNADLGSSAGGRAPAKPPSKTGFYKDLLSSLYNPQRGSRLATPG